MQTDQETVPAHIAAAPEHPRYTDQESVPASFPDKHLQPPAAGTLQAQGLELFRLLVEEFWGTNQISETPYAALTDLHDILTGLCDKSPSNRGATQAWLIDLTRKYLPEKEADLIVAKITNDWLAKHRPFQARSTRLAQLDDLPNVYQDLLADQGLIEDSYHGEVRDDT